MMPPSWSAPGNRLFYGTNQIRGKPGSRSQAQAQLIPRNAVGRTGMIDSAQSRIANQGDHGHRQRHCIDRIPVLVCRKGNRYSSPPFCHRSIQHRVCSSPLRETKHQCKAKNHRCRHQSPHRHLSPQLRPAVHTQGRWRILFAIAFLASIKDCGRRREEQSNSTSRAGIGDMFRAPRVHCKGLIRILLAAIDIGNRRQQQHRIRPYHSKGPIHTAGLSDIEANRVHALEISPVTFAIRIQTPASADHIHRCRCRFNGMHTEKSARAHDEKPLPIHSQTRLSSPRMQHKSDESQSLQFAINTLVSFRSFARSSAFTPRSVTSKSHSSIAQKR